MIKALFPLVLVSLVGSAFGQPQGICEGNGYGSCYIECGTQRIGRSAVLNLGSPALSGGGITLLSISEGFGPTVHPNPLIGLACLDFTSNRYVVFALVTDPSGNASVTLNGPARQPTVGAMNVGAPVVTPYVQSAPLYVNALTTEQGQFSLSKTIDIRWENPDSHARTNPLAQERMAHTATALGTGPRDNRTKVFLAGGGGGNLLAPLATTTTEIYLPLSRTFEPGPSLNVARTFHAAARLQDGRVLITGGSQTGGVCTATCEIYDPETGTITPTASMSTKRAGHRAALLPSGKVLVTGGIQDYQDATNHLDTVLNTAQNTAELWDPATGLWSPTTNNMASKRSGHGLVTLLDGRLFLVGGISGGVMSTFGGQVPIYTNSCEFYDPSTNMFAAGPPMLTARGFSGVSVLGNGHVLVTGGSVSDVIFGAVTGTTVCERFNGTSWTGVGALPIGIAFHTQVTDAQGRALIHAGFTGSFPNFSSTSIVGVHNGTTFTQRVALGTNSDDPTSTPRARGLHTVTPLHDGTYLVAGGSDLFTAFTDCYEHTDR